MLCSHKNTPLIPWPLTVVQKCSMRIELRNFSFSPVSNLLSCFKFISCACYNFEDYITSTYCIARQASQLVPVLLQTCPTPHRASQFSFLVKNLFFYGVTMNLNHHTDQNKPKWQAVYQATTIHLLVLDIFCVYPPQKFVSTHNLLHNSSLLQVITKLCNLCYWLHREFACCSYFLNITKEECPESEI